MLVGRAGSAGGCSVRPPYPPFLGFDGWPLVISFTSIPLTIGLAGTLVWRSIRQRRVYWAVSIAALVQFLWLRFGVFVYTEAVGPVLQIGHTYPPAIMVVYDCFIFATVAVLCVRDDDGELVLVNRLAQRLPSRSGRPKLTVNRQLLVAVSVGVVSFAVPLAVLAGLRVAQISHPAYDKFPYPEPKVYDPYGNLERAGKPGPFYT